MAAAKKPKGAAETLPVLAKQAPERYNAVVQIANLAEKFSGGEALEANVSVDNADKAVEVTARVRAAARELEALFDEAVKEHKEAITKIEKERNGLRAKLQNADKAVANKLVALYSDESTRGPLEKRLVGSMGSSATFSHRSVTVVVLDAKLVPDKYIRAIPSREERVDTKAIEAAIKAGEKVPGVRADPNYFITTRAAELVE